MTQEEYNNCVRLFADRVFRFAFKLLKQQADAEDIVQAAFEVLWRNHRNIGFDKARSYLFSVTHHKAIDQFRSIKRIYYTDELPEYTARPDTDHKELKQHIDYALDKLSEVQKAAVLLRDYEGYSYQEIGEILNLSESQVKVYIFRARQKLQQTLNSVL